MNRLIPLLAALASACAPTGQPLARPAYGDSGLAATDGGYRVSLVNEWGGGLPTYGRGSETWIEGVLGQRYQVRVDNPTGRRVEAVVTVDGRDVISGAPGGLEARGYVIEPWGHVIIDGFRTSNSGVATFRFTTPGDSYAGRVGGGANIGVIGVAVFEENAPVAMVPHHHDHPGRGWWGGRRGREVGRPRARRGSRRLRLRRGSRPAQRPRPGHSVRRAPLLPGERSRLPARIQRPRRRPGRLLRQPRGPRPPGHRGPALPPGPARALPRLE